MGKAPCEFYCTTQQEDEENFPDTKLNMFRMLDTNVVCSLQSSIVCDVFSKRLFTVDMFSINKIAAVLIRHTLCSLTKRLH